MLSIDETADLLIVERDGRRAIHGLGTPEAFAILSNLWLRAGWSVKHVYTFTWLGRPIIQLPEDMFRLQELILQVRPDVIVETGIAHGGSLVFYASLCRLLGRGRVIGVDVEIRPHNRKAIEEHPVFPLITLIEGDSAHSDVVAAVRQQIRPGETVFVVLDSNHTMAHVLRELEAYAPLVSPGSYIIAMDGQIMALAAGAARSQPEWMHDNPAEAAATFVSAHPDYVVHTPAFQFNESAISAPVSYSKGGVIKRIR